jgi:hypothetical protein
VLLSDAEKTSWTEKNSFECKERKSGAKKWREKPRESIKNITKSTFFLLLCFAQHISPAWRRKKRDKFWRQKEMGEI